MQSARFVVLTFEANESNVSLKITIGEGGKSQQQIVIGVKHGLRFAFDCPYLLFSLLDASSLPLGGELLCILLNKGPF